MIKLHHRDCRDVLRTLSDNSIDSVVTDPPYALVSIVKRFGSPNAAPANGNDAYVRASAGFMGKQWDTGETAFSVEFWAEALRVLKPGGHVAAFGASRGYHRMACAIEDAGFEIRDSLMWVYGSGFPKSQNVAKFIDKELGVTGETTATGAAVKRMIPGADQNKDGWIKDDGREFVPNEYSPSSPKAQEFDGFGTALKPAFEPIVLARKPLSEGTVVANVLRWGTGALNIDACRVEATDGANRARPPRTANEILGGGKGTNLTASEHNEIGRWPANVVHDGSDEVVAAFPVAGGQRGRASSNPGSARTRLVYGELNRSDSPMEPRGDSGSAARFFYSAKASKDDRAGSKHPTVKPVPLGEWLAKLVTPPGGTVLDPFAGSGALAAGAHRAGFRVVLCEREDEYAADIRRRFGLMPWE